MVSEAKKLNEELFNIYEVIGFLDSMISICSYRESLENWCIPEFDNKNIGIGAKNLYSSAYCKAGKKQYQC